MGSLGLESRYLLIMCDYCYKSSISYLTHRLGLAVSRYKGVLDRGFGSCTVPAFCCGPGILNVCRYNTLPMEHREVVELKGTTEIVSGCVQS